jgi:hypothetical protein
LDGALRLLDPVEGIVEIEPLQALEVRVSLPLDNYRVRVLDWNQNVVPSDDTASQSDAGLAYRIGLLRGLAPGRRYELLVDPQFGPRIEARGGGAFDDWRIALAVKGEPARATKTAKKRPSKRQRSR